MAKDERTFTADDVENQPTGAVKPPNKPTTYEADDLTSAEASAASQSDEAKTTRKAANKR